MNKRNFRPRSIVTPAVVSPRCELFGCSETRRWFVVEITLLGQISVGRSLSSGDNIRCLDRQRSDLAIRRHLVGDRRAGDEPDTDRTRS